MSSKILCAGFLIRHPVGGHTWHHLQYLIGLKRLGYDVYYFEHFGWPGSCYDPSIDENTSDPAYGIDYMTQLLAPHGLGDKWCYLAEDGTAHGFARDDLADLCGESEVFFNLSNMNWAPELGACRTRVLVDTDPVFTQIGGHGLGGRLDSYHRLTTYGESVHQPESAMPDGGFRWLPTRQPIVLDRWDVERPPTGAPFTTVMNWSAYGDRVHDGVVYGQKDREFERYFSFPQQVDEGFEIALGSASSDVAERFRSGGWAVADPLLVCRDPFTYQAYLQRSRGEFGVAKHAYVATSCGWFSDRSCGYLASGRPVILQDTGFSRMLPVGKGLLPFTTADEATKAIATLREDYEGHCRAARSLAEEFFDSDKVLTDLLEQSL